MQQEMTKLVGDTCNLSNPFYVNRGGRESSLLPPPTKKNGKLKDQFLHNQILFKYSTFFWAESQIYNMKGGLQPIISTIISSTALHSIQ